MKVAVVRIGDQKNGIDKYASKLGGQFDKESAGTDVRFLDMKGSSVLFLFKEVLCCESVLFQYSDHYYSGWLTKVRIFLLLFFSSLNRKIVTTFHDVYLLEEKFPIDKHRLGYKAFKAYINRFIVKCRYRLVVWCSESVVFLSEEELGRMKSNISLSSKFIVIPHFVDLDSMKFALQGVEDNYLRKKYGFNDSDIILSLLGVVHFRKGHHLIVELLPLLPANYKFLVAGGTNVASHDVYKKSLIERADVLGVRSKLIFTGFLSSQEYVAVIAQSDLGLAPFLDVSASGTLSDWMAETVPVLASKNHVSEGLESLSSSKIYLTNFEQKKEAVNAIIGAVESPQEARIDAFSALSLSNTADKYMQLFNVSG